MSRRSVLRALLALAGVVVALGAVAWWAARSGHLGALLRRQMLAVVRSAVAADVGIGSVEVAFPPAVVLRRVRVRVDGRTLLRLPRVRLDWAPLPLLRGRVVFRRAALERPSMQAVRTPAGWTLPGLRPGGGRGMPLGLRIRRLEIGGGRLRVWPHGPAAGELAFADLEGVLGVSVGRGIGSLTVARLGLRPRAGDLGPLRVAGGPIYIGGEGSACVRNLEIASDRSRLEIVGCAGTRGVADARIVLAPLAAGDLRALVPACSLRRDLRARVDVDGGWDTLGVHVAADLGTAGSLDADGSVAVRRAPRFRGRVRFTDVDPGGILEGVPPARLRGGGRVRVRMRDSIDAAYRIRLVSSAIMGREVERAGVHGRLAGTVHRIRARAEGAWGGGVARARIVTGERAAYRAMGRARIARLGLLVPGTDASGRARLTLEGEGTEVASARARLALDVHDASVEGVAWTHASLRAALADGRARLERLELAGPGLHAEGQAVIDVAHHSADWTLRAEAAPAALPVFAGAGAGGLVRAKVVGRGPFKTMSMDASIDGEHVAWWGVTADAVRLTARLTSVGSGRPGGRGRLEASELRVPGWEPRQATATIECAGVPPHGHCAVDATGRHGEGITERLALSLAGNGGVLRGELRELRVTPPAGAAWVLEAPARLSIGADAAIDRLELRAGRQRLVLHGRVAHAGTSDASLVIDELAVGPLCALRGPIECSGRISGRATLTGTAEAPALDASIRGEGLALGALANARLDVRAAYARRSAVLETSLSTPAAGILRAEATVPVDLAWVGPRQDLGSKPLSVTVSAQGLDLEVLRVLAPRDVRAAGGTVSLDLRVGGSRAAPRMEGNVELRDGSLTLAALGVPWREVHARLVADGTRLRLDALARAGEGSLHGSGYISLGSDGPPYAFVDLRLDRFSAFQNPRVEVALGGDLRVRGPLAAPEVAGVVDVTRMILRPPRLEAMITPLPEPDTSIEVVGVVEPVGAERAPQGHLADPVRLSLRLRLLHDAWVRWRDANVELGGEFEVDKEPYADVVVAGKLVLRRGWYAFQGRRFNLREGAITLSGAGGEPYVDVTGVHRVKGYDVVARVRGPASAAELTLSSEPPLEEADVLSLLIFGKPASELTQGQAVGLEERTMLLAGQYVIGELGPSVRDTLGLDKLEVELPEGQQERGVVTAGRYLGRDVLVSLGQEFGSSVAEVFGLEYAVTSRISLRGTTTTTGRSGADIVWRYRY